MDRKNEIIYATLELASENGLGTVSMQQIADKIGITKASLYNHYASRDQIVEAMYELLRTVSKNKAGIAEPDYDSLTENRSLKDILDDAVGNYKKMVSDPRMYLFYKVIMSERSINKCAAEIMVKETKTMINATKALFYALQVKGIADFGNVDAAALAFAMSIHAIIDYECDLEHAEIEKKEDMIQDYIDEFCRLYGTKGDKENGE